MSRSCGIIPDMTDALKEIVDVIVKEIGPERIILFGSSARDDGHAGSDIDLLVIVRDPTDADLPRRSYLSRIRRALRMQTQPIDLLLFSESEVERWRGSRNHLISTALREGKECYARS